MRTLAQFAVRHRRAVLAAWFVAFIAGIALGGQVFGRLKDTGAPLTGRAGGGEHAVRGRGDRNRDVGPVGAGRERGARRSVTPLNGASLTIRPVRNGRDLKRFVDLPYRLHAGTPWVPPLKLEQAQSRAANSVTHLTYRVLS